MDRPVASEAGRPPPELTIRCADHAPHTVRASTGPITVGRDLPAHIRITDQRVSRTHLLIEAVGSIWTVSDAHSTNGTFLDGERIEGQLAITDGLTVHIGHPEGIAVTFELAEPEPEPEPAPATAPVDDGQERTTDEIDQATAVAGAAVRARREELGCSRQDLEDDGAIGVDDLAAFERGGLWPQDDVRARIEKALKWPTGTIARVRGGGTVPDEPDETTEFITEGVRIAVLVDSLELTLSGVRARSATMAHVYDEATATLLADVRRAEATIVDAMRTSKAPPLVLLLGGVRRTHHHLVARAARMAGAPLGVRLLAARRDAELSPEEAANAAGVALGVVTDAEALRPVPGDAASALESLIAQLRAQSGR
jgi:transcriptional regulator with XRE-family HTH domain